MSAEALAVFRWTVEVGTFKTLSIETPPLTRGNAVDQTAVSKTQIV